jgi:hypothetical protein
LSTRYHAPSDDLSQPVDLKAAAEFNSIMQAVMVQLADNQARPAWKADSFFRRFANGE